MNQNIMTMYCIVALWLNPLKNRYTENDYVPAAARQNRPIDVFQHLRTVPKQHFYCDIIYSFSVPLYCSVENVPFRHPHRWPKLKTFVMHPDSRGVFLDVQLPGSGSSGGLVALDPAALRRAAVAGLATAINSAWPGQGPLERIRRAAAFTLAFAVRGPAGGDLGCLTGSEQQG